MPSLTEAHRELRKLEGTWTGEDVFPPSSFAPDGASAHARITVREALGGFAYIEDYEQRASDGQEFSSHGIFRWDAENSHYCLHWFDSFGGPPSLFRGTYADGRWVLRDRNEHGHWRFTLDVSELVRWNVTMEMSEDGGSWTTVHEGRYTRQP